MIPSKRGNIILTDDKTRLSKHYMLVVFNFPTSVQLGNVEAWKR